MVMGDRMVIRLTLQPLHLPFTVGLASRYQLPPSLSSPSLSLSIPSGLLLGSAPVAPVALVAVVLLASITIFGYCFLSLHLHLHLHLHDQECQDSGDHGVIIYGTGRCRYVLTDNTYLH